MPHDSKFDTVECGGAGDCAFTSIATALARWANTGATPKDLAPGCKLQGWLRCEAAKFMRQKRDEFADIGNPDSMATAVARAGTWADSPALCALAGALRLQFRIWAFDSLQNVWRLHLVGPDPGRNAPKKPRKASAQPAVVWLVLVDRHYQWLRPKGDDWILEEAVPGNAIRVHSSANLEILRGAGKASAASSTSSRAAGRGSGGSCARLLGLRRSASGGASCKTSGASSCARLLGIQNPLSVASAASSARKLLGLGRQTRASEASLPPEQLLGVEAAAAAHEPYKKADLYLCPCGWRPAEGTGADMRRRAQLHWRLCQGTAPPRVNLLLTPRSGGNLLCLSFRSGFEACPVSGGEQRVIPTWIALRPSAAALQPCRKIALPCPCPSLFLLCHAPALPLVDSLKAPSPQAT